MIVELIILFLLVLFVLTYWQMLWGRFKLPPGPFPWPIVGNLFQLDPVKPDETMYEWSKIYGPLFTVWMGPEPNIILANYEMLKEAMIKHGDQLAGRPYMFINEYLTRGNSGIGLSSGEAWKEQKRFALNVFKNFGLGRNLMEKRILIQSKRLFASIKKAAGSNNHVTLDLAIPIHSCITNVMSSILFDTDEKDDAKVKFLIKTTHEWFAATGTFKVLLVNSFPWLRHVSLFGRFGMNEVNRLNDALLSCFTAEVEKHKQQLEENETETDDEEPKDFLDAYLKEMRRRKRNGEDMSYFNEFRLRMIAADFWMAGTDSTASTFRWAILAMIKYPQVQRKVQEEIDAVLGDRLPTMTDRQSMPYVVATLTEVDRWGSVTPVNFHHSNENDLRLGGYNIPKGMAVIPQLSAVSIDEKIFPNPKEFRPERFLDDDQKTLRKVEEFVPYGLGKRQCMGEGMARTQLFMNFVYLLQRATVSVAPGQEEPTAEPAVGFISAAPADHECLVTFR